MINYEEVERLKKLQVESPDRVFTMYLNTDPTDPDQQGGKWKINLKNGLQRFEKYTKETNNEQEIKNFKQIKKQVNKFMADNEMNLQRGVIIFASAEEGTWFAEIVQLRLRTEFFLDTFPRLYQLETLLKDYPQSGIILVRQNVIKVIESKMNEVIDTTYFELNLETEDWHRKSGITLGRNVEGAGAGVSTYNFDARYKANQHRWYNNIAPKIDKLAKDNQWEQIIVVGEGEAVNLLKDAMNREIDYIINKNMLDFSDTRVLKEVFD